ncbi:16S rRNA (guanine(527)-N(7))-methyltransferase RsmG [Hoeflea poritis]|uniref:Ribosomal RNA small subunit methyltransferase G n=1 Tax=Hoeflea poritis TaxID=2993659 RepID=A0ABT4VMF7_9HYPH|nr:16S rRNA (guanine(527)-N(7))-methyltransferase RsmG [Hoeflea poritis]MDA4845355.1 16S rRNA (guanine(527)-N(7))-methyltransferase RsmG [Hoeflea poritis]
MERLTDLIHVSRETLDRLDRFVALFTKWSRAINLVAPSTLDQLWERHVLDSAQLYALDPRPRKWLDLGSGGGFPGIVMAILMMETEIGSVDLVESNRKKAAFLQRAIAETGARGQVHTLRIEAASQQLAGYQAVSARALADLERLLGYAEPWLAAGATGYFHKGRDYRREIDEARRSWSFDLLEHESMIDADSVILQIYNLKRIGG